MPNRRYMTALEEQNSKLSIIFLIIEKDSYYKLLCLFEKAPLFSKIGLWLNL